jgi:hypothetical protein
MALRELGENGNLRDVSILDHLSDFNRVWLLMTLPERAAIEAEINRRLEELLTNPDPNWGSITNTSIEGGKINAFTGIGGDWTGTPFQPIHAACGGDPERAGMFYGNVWKKVIIDRPEQWVGMRFDSTFPQRGVTLQGKTYFPDGGRSSA